MGTRIAKREGGLKNYGTESVQKVRNVALASLFDALERVAAIPALVQPDRPPRAGDVSFLASTSGTDHDVVDHAAVPVRLRWLLAGHRLVECRIPDVGTVPAGALLDGLVSSLESAEGYPVRAAATRAVWA
jgi:hypothetical protein